MRDPEDAIDEAYGAWLGSSGYANMQSYRDVFRDGWNAGREHEARNCPQEGRIAALKGEIADLQEQFDMYEASLHVEEATVGQLRAEIERLQADSEVDEFTIDRLKSESIYED